MKVIAAPGLKVPKEYNPREYITEVASEDIEITAYYLRRLADKELLEVADELADLTKAAAALKYTKNTSAA